MTELVKSLRSQKAQRTMETSSFSIQALCLLSLFSASRIAAQFPCTESSVATCDAYVAYQAQPPEFGSVKSVADLFGVASASLAVAPGNNALAVGQLVLVPITCGCNGSRYSAEVRYTVRPDDTYYHVAVNSFQNLTHWQTAVDRNPALKPNLLHAGDDLVIPLLCGCPSRSSPAGDRVSYLITYVWQPKDDVAAIAAKFNVSETDIVSAAVGSPVLIPVTHLPVLSRPRHVSFKRRWIIAIAAIALVVSGLAFLFAYTLCLCGKRRILDCEDLASESKQGKLLPGLSGYLWKPIVYDVATIMDATMKLDDTCKIGESVYKAVIDGKFVAVKRFNKEDEFAEELQILQKVNHGNLVNLLGISSGGGAGFLVYELAENGTLEACLAAGLLGFKQRLQVALDVAHGLHYLHEHAQPSLAHRHISASSVILDAGFKAKIGNFSKASVAEDCSALKADVSAFGSLVFELLSGAGGGETGMIRREVGRVLASENREREERVGKWIDGKLEGDIPVKGVLSLMAMAMACTHEKPLLRPSMGEIVFSLSLLVQRFSQPLESSWTCTMDGDELLQIRSSITAR